MTRRALRDARQLRLPPDDARARTTRCTRPTSRASRVPRCDDAVGGHRDLHDGLAGRREPGRLFARGEHGRHRRAVAHVRIRRAHTARRSAPSRLAVRETLTPAPSERVWGDVAGRRARSEAPPGPPPRAPRPPRRLRRRPCDRGADLSERRHVPRARGGGLRRPHRGPGRGSRSGRARPRPHQRARDRPAAPRSVWAGELFVGLGQRIRSGAR